MQNADVTAAAAQAQSDRQAQGNLLLRLLCVVCRLVALDANFKKLEDTLVMAAYRR
jgi:hypothetical protein